MSEIEPWYLSHPYQSVVTAAGCTVEVRWRLWDHGGLWMHGASRAVASPCQWDTSCTASVSVGIGLDVLQVSVHNGPSSSSITSKIITLSNQTIKKTSKDGQQDICSLTENFKRYCRVLKNHVEVQKWTPKDAESCYVFTKYDKLFIYYDIYAHCTYVLKLFKVCESLIMVP